MVAYAKTPYTTPEEYLYWERKAETKSEYLDGVVVAMAGAKWNHNVILTNCSRRLGNQLEATPCTVVTSEQRVRVEECNRYYYPDVVAVCGEPQLEDAELDTLLNPSLIIEVLSPSTEAKDRGEKFDCYQTLATLTTYILASQDTPHIEIYTRQADNSWRYESFKGLENSLPLPDLGCTLRLADIYANVTFPSKSDRDKTDS
jgi:Uma2 family endonuclease